MGTIAMAKKRGRKPKHGGPSVTVPIDPAIKSQLRRIADITGKDMVDVLSEICRAPVAKLYLQATAKAERDAASQFDSAEILGDS